jgi:hypothetical protein
MKRNLSKYVEGLVDAIEARATGHYDIWNTLYVTEGGTLILASHPASNDDNRPHDLIAIHPERLDGSYTAILRPAIDPEFREALEAALVARRG